MHLGVVGYLVTLANLQAIGGPNSQIKDLSVQVGNVASLANDLKGNPQFSVDHFRGTGYYRHGNVGVYLSNNLRKYIFENVNPGEEGTLITVLFKDSNDLNESSEEDNFSHILLRKHGFDENVVHDFIDKYLDEFHQRQGPRN